MIEANNIFKEVTLELIQEMKNDPKAWESGMTFIESIPTNIENRPYQGFNIIRLCYSKYLNGFAHNKWITPGKIKYLKGSINPAEKPTTIVNADPPRFSLQPVYNICQVEGLPDKLFKNHFEWEPVKSGEALYNSSECSIIDSYVGSNHPCYIPSIDTIYQPPQKYFNSAENYYSTLAHEMIHSTLHETRLNRNPRKYSYAYEELIAEIGACFTCASLGIRGNLENHASYLDSWLGALKKDYSLIFKASKKAQIASNYLLYRANQY